MDLAPVQRNRPGRWTLTFFMEDGVTRQNLANCTLTMYFKTLKTQTDAQAYLTLTIGSGLTIVDEANGVIQMAITSAQTNGLNWTSNVQRIPLYFSTVLVDADAQEWAVKGGSGTLPVVQG